MTNRSPTTSVLLADDHAVFRSGLRALLEESGRFRVIQEAGTGQEAVTAALKSRPDLVLMDLRMPQLDGIQATREILLTLTRTQIVILSGFYDDHQLIEALSAGARGYVLKDEDPESMLSAIDEAIGGRLSLGPTLASRVLHPAPHPVAVRYERSRRHGLTDQELRIFRSFAKGRVIREIAGDLNLTESTVRHHIRSAYAKLKLTCRAEAIGYAVRNGLIP